MGGCEGLAGGLSTRAAGTPVSPKAGQYRASFLMSCRATTECARQARSGKIQYSSLEDWTIISRLHLALCS